MDLFHSYPVAFIVTVIVPLVTGIVLSVGGYESLRARSESDAQLARIDDNTGRMLDELPELGGTVAVLERYEKALAASGQRDEALAAVLAQYEAMRRSAELWERERGHADPVQRFELAAEALEVLKEGLPQVKVSNELPGNPLLLKIGQNAFRVLFSVPMRIPPNIEFQGLPEGVEPQIQEKSKFGFTVQFLPRTVPVETFGFSADARL